MSRKILPVLLLAILCPASAQAYRYPVVLSGDSITESAAVRGDGWQGFGNQLARALAYRKIPIGGYGFVPTHLNGCCTDPRIKYYAPWTYSGKWNYKGAYSDPIEDKPYGANGNAAQTQDGGASISFNGNQIGVLYGTQRGGGLLTIQLDQRSPVVLNTNTSNPETRIYWIQSQPSQHTLKLSFQGKGVLEGVVVSRFSRSKTAEVEINQIGHGGATALEHTGPLHLASLRHLDAKLGIILFGANEEIRHMLDNRDRKSELRQGILKRAFNFRQDGAKCLVLAHPPIYSAFHQRYPKWRLLQAQYEQAAQQAARDAGCVFAQPWKNLWDPLRSKSDGWTTDYIHPSLRGYHLMSARLAKWLVEHKSWWLG